MNTEPTAGRLYVVATPIGNLQDISERMLRVLREVNLIAAEDTRTTLKLLDHFGITTPLTSYHEHNEITKTKELIERLLHGESIALVSDAGTPCVSDPGYRLVKAAHEKKIPVLSIPGPSAVIAALSVSGLPCDRFTFHGFAPRKSSEIKDWFEHIACLGGTHIFFESPHRLPKTLQALTNCLPNAKVCVARELTKIFEEVVTDSPANVLAHFSRSPVRGECVVIIWTEQKTVESFSATELRNSVQRVMMERGISRTEAVREVATRLGLPRRVVYAAAMDENHE